MKASTGGEKSGAGTKAIWKRLAIIAVCIVPAVWLLLFVTLPAMGVCRVFTISTNSMSPTFLSGDRVLVNELAYKFAKPHRGDLAAFSMGGIADLPPSVSNQVYMKRVAGLPGEKIAIRSGEVFINGIKAGELSAFHHVTMYGGRFLPTETDELLIPQDSYFVLGDNSRNSADSRMWGFIPKANFRGRVVTRLWHGKAEDHTR